LWEIIEIAGTVIRSYEVYSKTTVYVIWTGFWTAGAAIVGMLFFEESKAVRINTIYSELFFLLLD